MIRFNLLHTSTGVFSYVDQVDLDQFKIQARIHVQTELESQLPEAHCYFVVSATYNFFNLISSLSLVTSTEASSTRLSVKTCALINQKLYLSFDIFHVTM